MGSLSAEMSSLLSRPSHRSRSIALARGSRLQTRNRTARTIAGELVSRMVLVQCPRYAVLVLGRLGWVAGVGLEPERAGDARHSRGEAAAMERRSSLRARRREAEAPAAGSYLSDGRRLVCVISIAELANETILWLEDCWSLAISVISLGELQTAALLPVACRLNRAAAAEALTVQAPSCARKVDARVGQTRADGRRARLGA